MYYSNHVIIMYLFAGVPVGLIAQQEAKDAGRRTEVRDRAAV